MLVRLHDINVVPTGAIPLVNTVKYLPILIIVLCLYCYKVSVEKGEVKPFPNCTITGTATGYPQDIAFRTIMTPAMVYFILMMRTIYLMITGLNARLGRNANVPCEIWYFGLIGSLLYGIAMATIENGQMNNALHGGSAVIFFILFIIDLVLINKQLTQLRAINPSVLSAESLRAKKIITKIIVWTVIIELIHLIISKIFGVELWHERLPQDAQTAANNEGWNALIYGTDAEICIIEWVAVYGFAVYFYTFSWDWKNYAYVLSINASKVLKNNATAPQYDVIAPIFGTPAAYVRQPLVQDVSAATTPAYVEMTAANAAPVVALAPTYVQPPQVVLGTVVAYPQNGEQVVLGAYVPQVNQ